MTATAVPTTPPAEASEIAEGTSKKTKKPPEPDRYIDSEPLGIRCQVFGATGPKWSGKSMLAHQLAPGFHPAGHTFAGQSRTLLLDCEMSSASYSVPGVERIDVPTEIRVGAGLKEVKPLDVYEWFTARIRSIKPGRYDVIAVDPATDLEAGLLDWVRKNPGEFGATPGQFAKMPAIAIAAAKTRWKQNLIDIAARCKLFFFTAHLKAEWKGDRPTGNLVAKGYESLFEVASLYLQLSREKGREGESPKPPSAVVLKDRLSFQEFDADTGEIKIISILPERLPIATAKAIRDYVRRPVGSRRLKADEIAPDPEAMSDDQKLLLRAEIEQRRVEAAAMELEKVQQQAALQERAAQARARQAAANSRENDAGAGSVAGDHGDTPLPPAAPAITAEQQREMIAIAKKVWPDEAEMRAEMKSVLENYGVDRMLKLTESQASDVLVELYQRHATVSHDRNKQRLADAAGPGDLTPEQEDEINAIVARLWPSEGEASPMPNELRKLLLVHGVREVSQLSKNAAESLLNKLTAEASATKAIATRTPPSEELLATARELAKESGWKRADAQAWLDARGVKLMSEASATDVEALIAKFRETLAAFNAQEGLPGN